MYETEKMRNMFAYNKIETLLKKKKKQIMHQKQKKDDYYSKINT